MITAIVFDFDGVLADTERLHLAAFQEVFAGIGWALDEAAYFDHYLGCDDRGLVRTYVRDRGLEQLSDADVAALVEAKGRAFASRVASGSVLYPWTRPCIDALAGRFALGIASGALRAEIEDILEAGGLRPRFGAIVAADDVAETKPSPEPYLRAAHQLGVAPSACVAVEDSAPGLASARDAGMWTVAVTTTSPRAQLDAADRIIDDLAELSPDLVSALGSRRRV